MAFFFHDNQCFRVENKIQRYTVHVYSCCLSFFCPAMLFVFSSKHNFSRCLYIIYICMAINAGFFYFFESTSAVLVFTWLLVFMWVLAVLL